MRRDNTGSPVRCWKPSFKLCPRLLPPPPGAASGIFRVQSAAITPRNESAFTKKQGPVPTQASRKAAMAGPRKRDRLNWSEFRATAFGICAGGTMLVNTAW